jgi:hypothetical protein
MASVEDELNSLVRADVYRSKDDAISDAVQSSPDLALRSSRISCLQDP